MTDTIRLGGHQFRLRPPTLGQLRHVLDALDEMAGASGGALIDAAARLVAAGLAGAHPELTSDSILDLEASLSELNIAVAAILERAGLSPKELEPGEAEPRVMPSADVTRGSAPSTAPSPPAAAIPTVSSTI